jgi:hypothetical protein
MAEAAITAPALSAAAVLCRHESLTKTIAQEHTRFIERCFYAVSKDSAKK